MSPSIFNLEAIVDQEDRWGPSNEAIPQYIQQLPYAPFNKSDRLSKVADWTSQASGNYGDHQGVSAVGSKSGFGYHHEDDTSFSVVDRNAPQLGPTISAASGSTPVGRYPNAGYNKGRGSAAGTPAGQARFGSLPPRHPLLVGSALRSSAVAPNSPSVGSSPISATSATTPVGNQVWRRSTSRFNEKAQLKQREYSIKIGISWKAIEELDFSRLNKLYSEYVAPIDLNICGSLHYIDKTNDRTNAKKEKPLSISQNVFVNATASEDPVLQEHIQNATQPTIVTTDTVLAALMCATRSVYSWDLVVTKKGDVVVLDKRDGGVLDYPSVNENAIETPADGPEKDTNMNSPQALAHEALHINRNYAQQMTNESEKVVFQTDVIPVGPNALSTSGGSGVPMSRLGNSSVDSNGGGKLTKTNMGSVAYRYRQWDLGNDVKLVCRTQLDAAFTTTTTVNNADFIERSNALQNASDVVAETTHDVESTQFATIRCLNEFDSRAIGSGGAPDWRRQLDSQRGAVLATEFKNNASKLCRWTTESILAGASNMRIGFVSRVGPKDRKRHVILGQMTVKPSDFADQLQMDVSHGWGVIKMFADLCLNRLSDGKYVLVRDPAKPVLRLYQVVKN